MQLSIAVPAIRQHLWDRFYDSIAKSCKKYDWELIICGPFDLTPYLKQKNNVKYIKDFGHPTRCLQLCLFEAEGSLFYHTTDDALCYEDAIDEAIDLYNQKCGYKDVINMMYREGENYSGQSMPLEYWNAWHHGDLRLSGIPSHYKLSLHHMLKTDYIRELGGYNCSYQHANFSLHDLMFRLQFDGGLIHNSSRDVTTCNHYINRTVDHAAIFDSHNEEDFPLFKRQYSNKTYLNSSNIKIDINNWAVQEPIWIRRFKNGIPKSYEELL